MKKSILLFSLFWVNIVALAINEAPQQTYSISGEFSCDSIYNIPGANTTTVMENADVIEYLKNKANSVHENTNMQVVVAPQGWSGLSSFVVPDNPDIETLFSPLQDNLIMLYNLQGIYLPSQGVNTLGKWDSQSGYVAKFNQETNFELSGQLVENGMLSLNSGWNLIPVLSTCPVIVETLFENLDVVVVKEVAGWKLYWPDAAIITLDELLPGKAYFVLMNSPGEITFPECGAPPWQCGDDLIDSRDGQTYSTVQIGEQCWMAENLNTGTVINGSVNQSNNNAIEKYCYENDVANCEIYGGLYQWAETVQYLNGATNTTSWNPVPTGNVQGICPFGWHLPEDSEWTALTTFLGGISVAGAKMKSTGTVQEGTGLWNAPNVATNESGFSGLGAGIRWSNGNFYSLHEEAYIWSSTEVAQGHAWYRYLDNSYQNVIRINHVKIYGMTVRCLKDTCNQLPTQADAGTDQINLTNDSTFLAANSPLDWETGSWSLTSGTGGSFEDIHDPNALFSGIYTQTYNLKWTISNNCGKSTTDEVVIDFNYLPDSLFLVGGSCPAIGWWDPLSTIPFKKTAPGKFTIYAPLTVSGYGFKFLVEHSYNNNWGQAVGVPGKLAQVPNDNATVPEDGFYRIEVDFTTMSYSVVKTDWGILGSAVPPYDWSSDVNMNYIGGSEPFTWQIDNLEVQTGEFKFRANDSWVINFGDDGNDGSLEFYGANIPISAGIYTVKLILEPDNWTYFTITTCPGMPTVTYDGKTYNTVQIGDQCWIKENLNIGTFIAGTSEQTDNDIIEKYCYNNDTANCSIYGGLYQWNEIMKYSTTEGAQGICPSGWHIPTNAEWDTLGTYLGGTTVAGRALKETGTDHWNSPNTGATNSSGFTALGSGNRYPDFNFYALKDDGYFWSSTEYSTDRSMFRKLTYSSSGIVSYHDNKDMGLPVRCLKNNSEGDTLNPNAIVIDTITSQLLSDSTQLAQGIYEFQFSGTQPALEVGKIITGAAGNGYLRKITGVLTRGNPVILQTEQATMEDLFNTINFGFQSGISSKPGEKGYVVIDPKNISVNYLAEGVTLKSDGFTYDFSNTLIFEKDDLTFTITDGSVVFNPIFNADIDFWKFKLSKFQFSAENSTLALNCNVNLHAEAEESLKDFEKKLADINIRVTIPGLPVWVVINTKLKAKLTVDADAQVNVNAGFSDTYDATLGMKYLDNAWSGVYDITENLSVNPVEITGNVHLGQKLTITPEISVKLYGIVGPYIVPDLWEQFDLSFVTPSLDWNSSMDVGMDATVGAKATVLGFISSYSKSYPFSEEMWKAPDTLEIVSGNNQPGTPGQPLPYPLKVVVKDNLGNPLAAVPVHFQVTGGGGSINPESIATGTEGMAETIWTPGFDPGDQIVKATIRNANGETIADTIFILSDPYSIAILSGNDQTGGLGEPLAAPITVIVKDTDGNPFAGTTVNFAANNDGSVSQTQVTTGADGTAGVTWTLGPADIIQTVTVTAFKTDNMTPLQGSPVTFNAKIRAAYSIAILSGNNQTGVLGQPLAAPITVIVKEIDGNPFAGATVNFIANNDGSVSQAQAITGADGTAGVTWTLGPADSIQTVTVTAFKADNITPLQGSPLTFNATLSMGLPCPGLPNFTYGGQTYNTVQIGTQCWMKENLNYATGASWCYENNSANCATYGRLYDWNSALTACPSDWHLPTDAEWTILTDYLGGSSVAGGKMKEAGTAHWYPPNTCATNSSGFTALPGGSRDYGGSFYTLSSTGSWWSSSEYDASNAWDWDMYYFYATVSWGRSNKSYGFSVRCLKDNVRTEVD